MVKIPTVPLKVFIFMIYKNKNKRLMVYGGYVRKIKGVIVAEFPEKDCAVIRN